MALLRFPLFVNCLGTLLLIIQEILLRQIYTPVFQLLLRMG